MVIFGNDVNMPKCNCLDWESSCYPSKHFFCCLSQISCMAVGCFIIDVHYLPFLTLDNFDENDFFNDISHVEDQKISEGINNMNYQDESPIDMSHYQTENAKFATEIASRKRSRSNIPSEWCELLQKIKNITFETEESSEVLKELNETLYSTLERLYSPTKKEKGLTLNVEHAKVNSKFNLINMPVRKKKRNVSKVGGK